MTGDGALRRCLVRCVAPIPLLLILLSLHGLAQVWSVGDRFPGMDFYQFWAAARSLGNNDKASIYSDSTRQRLAEELRVEAERGGARFRAAARSRPVLETYSSPALYSSFRVFAGLTYERGYQLFRGLSLVSVLLALLILARVRGHGWLFIAALLAWVTIEFQPLRAEARVANVNSFQLLHLAVILAIDKWAQASDGRQRQRLLLLVGGLIAGAVLFKPTVVFVVGLLAVYWVARRQWSDLGQRALGAVAAGIAIVVVSSWVFGSAGAWLDWLRAVALLPPDIIPVSIGNFGPTRLVWELTGWSIGTISTLVIAAVAGTVVWVAGRRGQVGLELWIVALGCLIFLLTAPLVWQHYLILALPAVIVSIRPGPLGRSWWDLVAAVLALLLISINPLTAIRGDIVLRLQAVEVGFGLLLLFVLVVAGTLRTTGEDVAADASQPESDQITSPVTVLAWRPLLMVLAIAAVAYVVASPFGEYAVDDEWAYATSLEILHHEGRVEVLDWNPMTLVSHLVWGLGFTKILGFGFTVARLSTLALLVVEMVVMWLFLAQLGARPTVRVVALLALLFNPIHFFQGSLYATDVPAAAWAMASLLLYHLALAGGQEERRLDLGLAASLAVAMAWGVRQSGILPVAAVICYHLLYERSRRWRLAELAAFFAVPTVAVITTVWARVSGPPNQAYATAWADIAGFFDRLSLAGGVTAIYSVLAYVGLFVLPLAPLAIHRRLSRMQAVLGLSIGGVFLWLSMVQGQFFPYLRNKITPFGLLSPNEVILGDRPVLWGSDAAALIGIVVAVASVIWLGVWLSSRHDEDHYIVGGRRLVAVYLGLGLLYIGATMGIVFDRHLLILLAPALLVVASGAKVTRSGTVAAGVMLSLFAGYSVATTHDVHAFSRAAFSAAEDLLEQGVDPHLIDAGYAFDGWAMYRMSQMEMAGGKKSLARRHDGWWLKVLTPRIRSRYVVALSPTIERDWVAELGPAARGFALGPSLEGYEVLSMTPYRALWPPGQRTVFTLIDRDLSNP